MGTSDLNTGAELKQIHDKPMLVTMAASHKKVRETGWDFVPPSLPLSTPKELELLKAAILFFKREMRSASIPTSLHHTPTPTHTLTHTHTHT